MSIFSEIYGINQNFAKKVLNVWISSGFWDENDKSNVHSKFQDYLVFSGGNHRPLFLNSYRNSFFHQADRKRCGLDYLGALGNFLFGLGLTGKNSQGGGNHFPVESNLTSLKNYSYFV